MPTSPGVTAVVLAEAARVTAVHGLRAYDSVQLATAMVVRRTAPSCSRVAVFDAQLRAAVTGEGFAVMGGL